MKLHGIDFGHVLDASGVRGFFGEGYPHHEFLRPFGLRFDGSTFVAKTTTLFARRGNMPLGEDLSPSEGLPKCIVVKPFAGLTLNAVGLSGPGATALLEDGRWQKRTEPFFLSFMAVESTPQGRAEETRAFVALLKNRLREFRAPIGLQMNFSCPNVQAHGDVVAEARAALDVAAQLDIPLMPKIDLVLPMGAVRAISQHPACDALCASNALRWGALPDQINWTKLFGTNRSPLAAFGGGGLSGRPLLPLMRKWLLESLKHDITKPINAGGGILGPDDAKILFDEGASSVFVGSMAILRPWRVQETIRVASRYAQKMEDWQLGIVG